MPKLQNMRKLHLKKEGEGSRGTAPTHLKQQPSLKRLILQTSQKIPAYSPDTGGHPSWNHWCDLPSWWGRHGGGIQLAAWHPERDVCWCLVHFLPSAPGLHPRAWCCPHLEGILFLHGRLFWKHPCRRIQSCVSMVILDPVKLTKTNCHNHEDMETHPDL